MPGPLDMLSGAEAYRRPDYLAPQVDLICGGLPDVLLRQHVQSVEVSEGMGGAGTFSVQLQDVALEGGALRWMDHPVCQPGTTMQIRLGYASNRREVIDGYIEAVTASFSDGPGPSLTLTGADRAAQALRAPVKGVQFREEMTDSDAVAALARSAKLQVETHPTSSRHWTNKVAGTTVQQRVAELAQRTGYDFFLQGRTIHFKRKGSRVRLPRPVLTWGENLLSLSASMDLSQCVSSVVVQAIDRVTGQSISATARAGSEPRVGDQGGATASQLVERAYGDTPRYIGRRPVSSHEEAQLYAESELNGASTRMARASCTVIGDPAWQPGLEVELRGVGNGWLRGIHRVRDVRHTINAEGYRCSLTLERSNL